MPRNYVPKPGAKRYKKYDELIIKQALDELSLTGNSISTVAKTYKISKSVLCRHKNREMKPHGRPTALTKEEEEYIVENLNICGDWGYPLDSMDLRYIIKMYLDGMNIQHKIFKHNLPGIDYVSSFLKRHKNKISQRICQNIKRSRAAVSPEVIKDYFGELSKSLQSVFPKNIINYDETNLTDDPGRKKVIVRRGCKYPERVVNHSKGSVSLMMSATAEGVLLPPYVVYKATHLYDSWTLRGPLNARYNRSSSGWFDGDIFADWFKTVVIPFFTNKEGVKVVIGDNLSSHLSIDIIQLAKENNIHFVFLPANSTHLTQPLDVAFFRPMKIVWRQILQKWKRSEDGRTQSCVPKGCFPRLLKLLVDQLQVNAEKNICSGFRKCGLVPIDPNEVLRRLPQPIENEDTKAGIDGSFLQLLKEMRYGTMNIKEPKNKRKLEVVAGKSVSGEESENNEEKQPDKQKKIRIVKQETVSKSPNKSLKGKGIGKKTKPKIDIQIRSPQTTDESIIKNENTNVLPEINNYDVHSMPILFADNNDSTELITDTSDTCETDSHITKQQKIKKELNEVQRGTINILTNIKSSQMSEESMVKNENTKMLSEINDYDVHSMPVFFADNDDCTELLIDTSDTCETDSHITKKQKIKKKCNEVQRGTIKILSNTKLPLPVKSKSNLKSAHPKKVRRLDLKKDEEEILNILEDK